MAERLNFFLGKDHPVELTAYGKKHNLLETESWKRFKSTRAIQETHLHQCLVKQAKLRSFRPLTPYMYGYNVPKNYKEVIAFDKRNKNNKCKAANFLEHEQLAEYLRYLFDTLEFQYTLWIIYGETTTMQ